MDIKHLPVRITYAGEIFKSDWSKNGQTVDKWMIALTSKSGYWSCDYFTGTGLRSKKFPNKPVKPEMRDVLESLILDASAADYNFADWCSEYGYSDDSIKALNTYKACLETATALRKHLGRETLQQVRAIIEGGE
jgi:hypothetical protein